MALTAESICVTAMTEDTDDDKRRAALQSFMDAKGVKVPEVAQKAGISRNTLYEYLKGNTASMLAKVEKKVADALGASQAEVFGDTDAPMIGIPPTQLPLIGLVQAGSWTEEPFFEATETVSAVPDPRYKGMRQYALKVVGTSMNQRIREGAYALCVDWADLGMDLQHDQIVVVQRHRAGMYETTIKQVDRASNGHIQLMPRSNDPKHQDPLVLNDGHQEGHDDVEVQVVALVWAATEVF